MSNIAVQHVTFCHEGSLDPLFADVSFMLDTDWKLGFIGRNGRGKTTFLRLLLGDFPYQGTIAASVSFSYFPFDVPQAWLSWPALRVARSVIADFEGWEARMGEAAAAAEGMDDYAEAYEQYVAHDGFLIDELIEKEAGKLGVRAEALSRSFHTLSPGEQSKVLLAALFLRKEHFLLIDEPTNHLDAQGRDLMARYLSSKRGFILVSHDRTFLDQTIDHVLSINKTTIEVQQGNFSSWLANKDRKDQFELEQNQRLKREIGRLSATAREKSTWSDAVERTKIGGHVYDRGAVGHKAAKMMQRAKAIEQRTQRAIEEKSALLHDVEVSEPVKLVPLAYHKERLLEARDLSIGYTPEHALFAPMTFEVLRGDRIALSGPNGCGKSSLLKLLIGQDIPHTGVVRLGSGLILSYLPQRTDHLAGTLSAYVRAHGLEDTLVRSLLRKLDFSRAQFDCPLEHYSEGQKKKLLIAASLSQQAHLYLWDEPLNFIDVLSRMQIEALITAFEPTLLFVEHDRTFCQRIATRILPM